MFWFCINTWYFWKISVFSLESAPISDVKEISYLLMKIILFTALNVCSYFPRIDLCNWFEKLKFSSDYFKERMGILSRLAFFIIRSSGATNLWISWFLCSNGIYIFFFLFKERDALYERDILFLCLYEKRKYRLFLGVLEFLPL